MKLSKKLSKEYQEKGVIASQPICNDLSIKIYDISYGIEEYVIYQWGNEEHLNKSKLSLNNRGDVQFRISHTWYNLNDFMRV